MPPSTCCLPNTLGAPRGRLRRRAPQVGAASAGGTRLGVTVTRTQMRAMKSRVSRMPGTTPPMNRRSTDWSTIAP